MAESLILFTWDMLENVDVTVGVDGSKSEKQLKEPVNIYIGHRKGWVI